MAIPHSITREHILHAIADLDSGVDIPFGEATKYELIHDGRRFSPKAVVGLASQHATGEPLNPGEFSGGNGAGQANDVLRKLGFQVVEHTENNVTVWLLTWNPKSWEWKSLSSDIEEIRKSGSLKATWSTGNTKSIRPSDRLFLLRQGVDPKGIIASATAISEVFQVDHWDPQKAQEGVKANSVELVFDSIVPVDRVLSVASLRSEALSKVHWTTQSSGIRINEKAAAELEARWAEYCKSGFRLPEFQIDLARVERIKSIFRQKLPDFKTFNELGATLKQQEDEYKREAVKDAKEILGPYVEGQSVVRDDDDAQALCDQLVKLTNFFNWRDYDYIWNKLFVEPGRWLRFFSGVLDCLKAPNLSAVGKALEPLLTWLAEIECAPNITKILASYPLFLYRPQEFISIKSDVFDRFLERLGAQPLGRGHRLKADEYLRVMDVLSRLRTALADWKPRDFVDIHHVHWVVEKYSEPESEIERAPSVDSKPLSDPVFTVEDAMTDLFMARDSFESVLRLLRYKMNLIIQGPPGTGKTFVARRLAYALMGEKSPDRISMVQFHQSYSYEDFIQGYRPNAAGGFRLKDGVFLDFCRRAAADLSHRYVFVIDEINRGNLSKILGEVLMLIEADKRGPGWAVPLTYAEGSSETFHVPPNCYLIGTMNTADRSLAMVDYALRRRFAFHDLAPAFGMVEFDQYLAERGASADLISHLNSKLQDLNFRIAENTSSLGPGYQLGHSFFCPSDDSMTLDTRWYQQVIKTEIGPIIREYWFDAPDVADAAIAGLLQDP